MQVVVILTDVSRKPGITCNDFFNTNVSIGLDLAEAVTEVEKAAVYNSKIIFVVTPFDIGESNTFFREAIKVIIFYFF